KAPGGPKTRLGVPGLLLLVEVVALELPLELLDAARGVHEGALAGEEGGRAGPDRDPLHGHGGADGQEYPAVVERIAGGVVGGVNIALHGSLRAQRRRPARPGHNHSPAPGVGQSGPNGRPTLPPGPPPLVPGMLGPMTPSPHRSFRRALSLLAALVPGAGVLA